MNSIFGFLHKNHHTQPADPAKSGQDNKKSSSSSSSGATTKPLPAVPSHQTRTPNTNLSNRVTPNPAPGKPQLPSSALTNQSQKTPSTLPNDDVLKKLTTPVLSAYQQNVERMALLQEVLEASSNGEFKDRLNMLMRFIKLQPVVGEESRQGLTEFMDQFREKIIVKIQDYPIEAHGFMLMTLTALTHVQLEIALSKPNPSIDHKFLKVAQEIQNTLTDYVTDYVSKLPDEKRKRVRMAYCHLFDEQIRRLEGGKRFQLDREFSSLMSAFKEASAQSELAAGIYKTYSSQKILWQVGPNADWGKEITILLMFAKHLKEKWSAKDIYRANEGISKQFRESCFQEDWYEMVLLLNRLREASCYAPTLEYREKAVGVMIDILNFGLCKKHPDFIENGRVILLEIPIFGLFEENVLNKAEDAANAL